MHMKFMLLFYKTGRLRVVVSTANLVDFDYRDIENTVWLQDVPLCTTPIPHDPKATDDFGAIFQRVLRALNVAQALNIHLNRLFSPYIPQKVIKLWGLKKFSAPLPLVQDFCPATLLLSPAP